MGLAALVPAAIYNPWVQNKVKDIACDYASRKTGMDINVGHVNIDFPLDITADSVLIVDEKGDTMLQADQVQADVKVKPLIDKKIEVDEAKVKNGKFNMTTDDGSTELAVDADSIGARGVKVDLNKNRVDVVDAAARGGKIAMKNKPYKKEPSKDDKESKPWQVNAQRLTVDDIDYEMEMKPTIDHLDAHVGHAQMRDGHVDTGKRSVDVGGLEVDSADVNYEHPSEADAKKYNDEHPIEHPEAHADNPNDSVPWKVHADSLRLTNSRGRYARTGAKPKPAGGDLDTDNIEVKDVDLAVDDFNSNGSNVTVPVKHVKARERSGLNVRDGSGTVSYNDRGVDLDNVKLRTDGSDINLDGHIDKKMLDDPSTGQAQLSTDSRVSLNEAEKIAPDLRPTLKDIPHNSPVGVKGKVSGNTSRLDVHDLEADIPGHAKARMKGTIYNPTDSKRRRVDADVEADLSNTDFISKMLPPDTRKNIKLPPMKLRGKAQIQGDNMAVRGSVSTGGGTLSGKGTYNTRNNAYDIDATTNNFNVKSIVPSVDVRDLTGHVKARGRGFDFTDCGSTYTDATIALKRVKYNGNTYRNINGDVHLHDGYLTANVDSRSPGADLNAAAQGTICNDHYVFTADGTMRDVDLEKLGLYKGTCNGRGSFSATGDINLRTQEMDAQVDLQDLDWQLDSNALVADKATATLHTTDTLCCFTAENEDNIVHLNAWCGPRHLFNSFKRTADIASYQVEQRGLNIDTLQQALPHFDLQVRLGRDGLVQRYLSGRDIDFRKVECDIYNDSNIYIDGLAHAISIGETNIDTVTLHATEWNKYLAFKAHMGNRPGTMDEFAQVDIEGGVRGPTIDFLAHQRNIKDETGYRLGLNATLTDTAVNMKLFPEDPIIGYRQWTINMPNYANYSYRDRMLDADLQLSSDSSRVSLLTSREPGSTTEDIDLRIENLKLEEWTRFIPTLDMSGVANATVDVTFDGRNVEGNAVASVDDLFYKGRPEGDFGLTTQFDVDPTTVSTRLQAELTSDGKRVATAQGTLNDSTAATPLNMDVALERFPLRKANPFIPGNYVSLTGFAVAGLNVTGTLDNPRVSGTLTPDSAYVMLPRYGASLRMADQAIPVDSSIITLDHFPLYGSNDQPITVDGVVDLRDLDNMGIDLDIEGKNVQIIDAEQEDWNQVFGKAAADITATVKSKNNIMDVRANVDVLSGSNVTYVMKNDITTLQSSTDEDMVTFVNFNDTTSTAADLVTARATSATNVLVNIGVAQGSKINVFLSEDGQNRATIDGSGRLKYSLDFAGRDNLTGTYTIESGNVRYTPPLISQKDFDITSGSTLVWTGDMLNPTLNLTGTQRTRTSVSSDSEGTRLVDFIITATVGGTLSSIDLGFDLSTTSDMTVQNELQSMTDVQRSQAAINMLLYSTYSGTNSAGTVNNLTASNALFSFLQSQLNSWAARTIKGVDLSFGINQFEGTRSGGTQTSYSYRLSKTLFNDRFRIVVGGEYNTDAAESAIAENLFNDLSIEYNLNTEGSKYLRLFRHTGYESILEGQVTETGVGFVMKRKLSSLRDLFKGHSQAYKQMRDSLRALEKAQKQALRDVEDAISQGQDTVGVSTTSDGTPTDTSTTIERDSNAATTTNDDLTRPVSTRRDDENP